PGARDEVVVTLSPPRGVEATAGDHSFGVAVRSSVRGVEVRAVGVMSVSAAAGFSLAIQPVRSTRVFQLAIENTGNAPAAVTLAASDDEGRLRFELETLNVDLRPGERRSIELRVKLPGAPKLGPEVIKSFRVEAAAQGTPTKQTASGQLRIKPKLEPWRIPAMAVVVLGALAGGGVAYASRCEDWSLPGCKEATPTGADGDGQGSATGTPGTAAAAGGTPTSAATKATTQTLTPKPAPTTPAPSPTKHAPGTLRFAKAEVVLDPKKAYLAVISTTAGEFTIELDVATSYNTSNSFAFLAQKGFYDGMKFDALGASVEQGDPVGDGTGTAGYVQEREFPRTRNLRGTVGMIPTPKAPGSVGSEWYINLEDNVIFDRGGVTGVTRPVFAQVVKGLEVVERLTDKDSVDHISIREK
ncbi:MAG: peptidylprolyl isomerase, partial [Gemmatimonadales bacterium]